MLRLFVNSSHESMGYLKNDISLFLLIILFSGGKREINERKLKKQRNITKAKKSKEENE